MVKAKQVYETVLYASNLDEAATFYVEGFGLKLIHESELFLVFEIQPAESYLLIFDPAKSVEAGRDVPSHGATGAGHIAFLADEAELPAWRERLATAEIEIEQEVQWDKGNGGTSIYVRDPAGNSVELAPRSLWSRMSRAD